MSDYKIPDYTTAEIKYFLAENPWLTKQWFEKNKSFMEFYFECELNYGLVVRCIMDIMDIEVFLDYVNSSFSSSYDSSIQSN